MTEGGQQSDFLRCGWLMKMGLRHKALKKRFFVLTKDKITYSKTVKSSKPQGTILISEVVNVEAASDEEVSSNKYLQGASNIFKIITKDRTFMCSAETSVEMNAWISVIENVLRPS